MVLLFHELERFQDRVALADELLLFIDERVGVGESVEGLPRDFVLGDGLVLEVRVFEEEVVDELGIKVTVIVAFEQGVPDMLQRSGILHLEQVGVFVELGTDDPVLHEIFDARSQMHAGPAPIVHALMILINLYQIIQLIGYSRQEMKGQRKRIGKYIIFLNQPLGSGSFAEVYLGIAEESKEEVAVKVVRKDMINEDEYTKNAFYSEIQISKKLKSPNIINFYDVHETLNNFYIILELAKSGTLRQKMTEEGRFDEKKTVKCLVQLLNGFGELIKNGITHRDLKPENILLKGQELKIGDFGFAKISSNNTSCLKTMVGTPAYMAPQILNEEKYTYKCDIWSLGVMAYEMIVGRLPWLLHEKTLPALKKEVMSRLIAFPEHLKISDDLKDFIRGCLCIDEAKRMNWQQIFLHPLFEGRFKKNFQNKQEGSTEINFIMSNLRLNVHSKNINLSRVLNKCQQKLSQAQFVNLMTFIDKEISPEQITTLYKHVANPDGNVYVENLTSFLLKHQCRMTGIDFSRLSNNSSLLSSKPGISILVKLKLLFEGSNIDVCKFMLSQGHQMRDSLDIQAFGSLILKIDPTASPVEIRFLFNEFDFNSTKLILFEHAYRGLCKIAETIPIMEE